MKHFLLQGLLLAGLVLTPGSNLHYVAHATDGESELPILFTPPFYVTDGNFLDCRLVNVSNHTITARIQILAQDGSGVQDTDFQLVDGGTVQFVFADSTNNPQYCRFSGNFTREKIRAIGAVYNTAHLPVASAQAE